MLAGLEATPAAGGGFTFRHRDTGLAFAIGPAPAAPPDEDSDAEGSTAEPELAFQPISLGSASEVHITLSLCCVYLYNSSTAEPELSLQPVSLGTVIW